MGEEKRTGEIKDRRLKSKRKVRCAEQEPEGTRRLQLKVKKCTFGTGVK